MADLLAGQQLDARARLEEAWTDIQALPRRGVRAGPGSTTIEAEELAILPGLDEIFALTDIKTHVASGEWDVVVVDCAPTAETIRLLSLPDVLAWYMDRIFPVHRRINRVVSPMVRRLTTLPAASDEVFAGARRFYDRLEGVRELLTDPKRTSVRLVVNPERMVVAEARRTYTYLSLFGYRVDAVIANRLLPDRVSDPWFDQWKAVHAEHLTTINEAFAPLPDPAGRAGGHRARRGRSAAGFRCGALRRARPGRPPPPRRADAPASARRRVRAHPAAALRRAGRPRSRPSRATSW